jgi:murein DD-endopeptidase MepM/ murein hydrolase activator NlpD
MAFLSVPAFRDEFRQVDEPAKARKFYLFDPAGDGHPAWFSDLGVGAVRDLMRTPVDGARVSSGFGYRNHPILDRVIFHKGVDLACPVGTPVYAAADGVVIRATDPPHSGGYGNFLNIRHNEHLVTCYAHNSRFADGIALGVKVTQGQTVAYSGNTGNSTGPHLHFEIRVDDQPVDPLSFKTSTTHMLEGDQLVRFKIRRDQIDAAGEGCV